MQQAQGGGTEAELARAVAGTGGAQEGCLLAPCPRGAPRALGPEQLSVRLVPGHSFPCLEPISWSKSKSGLGIGPYSIASENKCVSPDVCRPPGFSTYVGLWLQQPDKHVAFCKLGK